MGLFGSKKEEVMPKVSDVFSAELLQKIREIVGPKQSGRAYGKYGDMAETLLKAAEDPEKECSKREWTGIIYAAGGFTKLEPQLAPMLKQAIEKYRSLK